MLEIPPPRLSVGRAGDDRQAIEGGNTFDAMRRMEDVIPFVAEGVRAYDVICNKLLPEDFEWASPVILDRGSNHCVAVEADQVLIVGTRKRHFGPESRAIGIDHRLESFNAVSGRCERGWKRMVLKEILAVLNTPGQLVADAPDEAPNRRDPWRPDHDQSSGSDYQS